LVWAQLHYSGEEIDVIRLLVAGPGDAWPNTREAADPRQVPQGKWFLSALATNGIDSRQVGAVETARIRGKAAFVLPAGQLMTTVMRQALSL
jgi:hypothetical protein